MTVGGKGLRPNDNPLEMLGELEAEFNALYDQRMYAQARELAKQALKFARQEIGPRDAIIGRWHHYVGMTYEAVGGYATSAELEYKRGIEIYRLYPIQQDVALTTTLTRLGMLYKAMGDYKQAEPLFQEALAIRRRVLGEQHPAHARSLNNLAALYHGMGDYVRAEVLYQEALTIRRRVLGANHAGYATSLNNLGLLYKEMGEYTRAEPLYQEALVIRRRVLGVNHSAYAASLNNLAALYRAMGDYLQARQLYQEAHEIGKRVLGEQHPDHARSLNNLGLFYEEMGEYARAEVLYQEALDITKRVLGNTHPTYATSLDRLGGLYHNVGDYARAEVLYQEALTIRRRVLGANHAGYATSLNNLGVLYNDMGEYARAEVLYQEALDITKRVLGNTHPTYATILNHLGGLYHDVGDYVRAEVLYQEALAIRRRVLGVNHPSYARSLNNLGVLYNDMGEYARAEVLYQEALDITKRVLGNTHRTYATKLNNLGVLYKEMGDLARAESLYQEALDITKRVLGEQHPDHARSLNNLGLLYKEMGEYARAEVLYQEALDITKRVLGDIHPTYAASLNNSALLKINNGDHEAGRGLLMQAVATAVQNISIVFAIASDRQRMAYLRLIQGRFDIFLSLIVQSFASSAPTRGDAFDAVIRRKGLATQALALQGQLVFAGKYPELADTVKKWQTLRAQIARKTLDGPRVPKHLDEHHQLLAEWTSEKERLESVLAKAIPEITLAQILRDTNVQTVADALPPDSVLIEFVRYHAFNFHAVPRQSKRQWNPARYLALVLPAGQPATIHLVDLGEAQRIDVLIDRWRFELTGQLVRERVDAVTTVVTNITDRAVLRSVLPSIPASVTRDVTMFEEPADDVSAVLTGNQLRAVVWDPIVHYIGECRRVFIAPDGDLARLPFETLPLVEKRFLVDQYDFSYVNSGRDLMGVTVCSERVPTHPLVVADPDFNLGSASDLLSWPFGPLPGSRQEGEQVARALAAELRLAGDGVKSHVIRRQSTTGSPSIMHLATHGFFLPEEETLGSEDMPEWAGGSWSTKSLGRLSGRRLTNPLLRSGLAFAGVNTWLRGDAPPPEAEDGLLTAEDVARLDLLETELVVLSACDTGLGQIHVGEGVFGLRRAFMLAGAKTLIMSLWKVPDRATQELMIDFYERLLRGEGRAEALRAAQLEIKQRKQHPRYWGAFICQGDPGPLPEHVLEEIRRRKEGDG